MLAFPFSIDSHSIPMPHICKCYLDVSGMFLSEMSVEIGHRRVGQCDVTMSQKPWPELLALAFTFPEPGQSHCWAVTRAQLGLAYGFELGWNSTTQLIETLSEHVSCIRWNAFRSRKLY